MTEIIWHQLPSDLSLLIGGYVGTDRIKPCVKAIGPINWDWLSKNPSAIELLMANPDKINWYWLSKNSSAIRLLKANPDKINWSYLSQNPSAIDLLESNKDKIHTRTIWANPAIFEPEADYFALLMQVRF
jgi:hypothetical protein